jgi:hypothetical protein
VKAPERENLRDHMTGIEVTLVSREALWTAVAPATAFRARSRNVSHPPSQSGGFATALQSASREMTSSQPLMMLAEAPTTSPHGDRDSRSTEPLRRDAKDGGTAAGRTRKDIERQTRKPVISKENFKQLSGRRRRS